MTVCYGSEAERQSLKKSRKEFNRFLRKKRLRILSGMNMEDARGRGLGTSARGEDSNCRREDRCTA